ncbi:inositol 5-phosphatase [Patellaria atrata CBS 101060]|uniref:Inositol 5-phosphatase n=1 Tax=Patellaria atrata CBS 101060 TaxID=1346257 RepID=A0A9P4S273_9PEZI|nr:inositol 5-phosphatase [Patellaria atrata CBS 101060]
MSPLGRLELYLITFNCARQLIDPAVLGPQLFRALPHNASLPDIVVVSLQEIAPIAYSFLGGLHLVPYFARVTHTLQVAVNSHDVGNQEQYKNVITRHIGMTAIMIFAKPDVASKIKWISTAGVGVGLWEMGNKGAVGVKLGYALGSRDKEMIITLIAAHLAPMENAVMRRNADWANIVKRLVFTSDERHGLSRSTSDDPDNEEQQPLLTPDAAKTEGNAPSGLYDPRSHVFFAGDLNYRAHNSPPTPSAHTSYPQPTSSPTSPKHYSHFLPSDQLTQQLRAGRTLHGFTEPPIAFPPTYKYSSKQPVPSSSEEPEKWIWARHRFPSWCDRILYLPSPFASPQDQLVSHTYTALPIQPTSDHRPVALSISVPLKPVMLPSGTDDVRVNPPFAIDPNWKARRGAARTREQIVGLMAYFVLTWEGRRVLFAILGGALGGWVLIRYLLFR